MFFDRENIGIIIQELPEELKNITQMLYDYHEGKKRCIRNEI